MLWPTSTSSSGRAERRRVCSGADIGAAAASKAHSLYAAMRRAIGVPDVADEASGRRKAASLALRLFRKTHFERISWSLCSSGAASSRCRRSSPRDDHLVPRPRRRRPPAARVPSSSPTPPSAFSPPPSSSSPNASTASSRGRRPAAADRLPPRPPLRRRRRRLRRRAGRVAARAAELRAALGAAAPAKAAASRVGAALLQQRHGGGGRARRTGLAADAERAAPKGEQPVCRLRGRLRRDGIGRRRRRVEVRTSVFELVALARPGVLRGAVVR